ncbi:MAG: hypothetical protein II873_07515 [Oscillospiraceae bacterium]|nr:hypothetical protein [Oscillospiraceae bacterium]
MKKIFMRMVSLFLAVLMVSSVPQTCFGHYYGYGDELEAEWKIGNLDGNVWHPFTSAWASSTLKEGDIIFRAGYAIDNKQKYQRPWVEGVRGSGIGETLTLYFDDEYCIGGLTFRLGYARDQARYNKNNRPSELLISFSDGSYVDCWFEDINAEQSIVIPDLVYTNYVEITILNVYCGTQCDDTCIYQVKAYEMVG